MTTDPVLAAALREAWEALEDDVRACLGNGDAAVEHVKAHRTLIEAAIARSARSEGLTEAWDAAEAALPDGWFIRGVRQRYVGAKGQGKGWSATAVQGGIGVEVRTSGTVPSVAGFGDSPTAALRALVRALHSKDTGSPSEEES